MSYLLHRLHTHAQWANSTAYFKNLSINSPAFRVRNSFSKPVLIHMITLVVMGMLFTAKSHAQSLSPEWIKDTVVDHVEFYHSIINCGDNKAVLLKFNNLNRSSRKISWKEILQTQSAEKEAATEPKVLLLPPGITSATDCNETVHRNCLLLPMDVSNAYAVLIRQYFFTDISVTTNQ